jgi:hypothetical protein
MSALRISMAKASEPPQATNKITIRTLRPGIATLGTRTLATAAVVKN